MSAAQRDDRGQLEARSEPAAGPGEGPDDPGRAEPSRGYCLVLGGTGAVGRALLAELAARGRRLVFTWHRSEALARELAAAHGAEAARLDLADPGGTRAWLVELLERRGAPATVIHAAADPCVGALDTLTDAEWARMQRVSCHSVVDLARILGPRMGEAGGGDVLLIGALDRSQSLPIPVGYAACQGMLSALAMALARELGPRNVRINVIALGLLETGLSTQLDPRLREDYLRFSALRRLGTAEEAARAIARLADGMGFMNGKVLPINGGI